jgi:hypothetical protein
MWGHNRPASEEPAESSILWLRVHYDCRTLRLATGEWNDEKEPQAPEGDKCAWGCRGETARKKQGATNYFKHANRYGRPQLL